ncbi:MAG: hypothetical protein AAF449_06310 [Myxococcota bacterium]
MRSPIDSTRIRNDLGLTFMTPEEAVDDYARWSIASGTDFLSKTAIFGESKASGRASPIASAFTPKWSHYGIFFEPPFTVSMIVL